MLKRNFIPILILLIILAFILQPNTVFEGAFKGLNLWITKIVPFLFPMFILSNILLQYNFIYRLLEKFSFLSEGLFKSKFALIPFIISFISGYPSGALIVNIMTNNRKINKYEANYILSFTNNCSFQFISAVVAFSMLGDFNLYFYIAIPHYLGAILLSILYKNKENNLYNNIKMNNHNAHFNEIFSNSISKAVLTILTVGGVIVFFSIFSQYITNLLLSNSLFVSLNNNIKDIIFSLLIGFIEIINGCNIISSSALPIGIKLIIVNFLISFQGISIIFQTIAVTTDFSFDLIKYIWARFIFGIISALICIIMLIIF